MWRETEKLVKEGVYEYVEGTVDRYNLISPAVYETSGYCGLAGKP
jgi:hypothetical protein